MVAGLALALALAIGASSTAPTWALEGFEFLTPGADKSLRDALRGASLLVQAERDKTETAQDLFGAAQNDYGRLLGALYAEGYYSAVIRIRLDGREAASIAPLDAPSRIDRVSVTVEPGPRFRFAQVRVAPLAPGSTLPRTFAGGEPARSGAIVEAAAAGIDGWRGAGHARARVAAQDLTADHRNATLDADITLAPGPRVRFGALSVSGHERMREGAIRRIAGFPAGETFDPAALERVAGRLRRSGVFRSVTLTEAAALGEGDSLDVALGVAEEAPRRLGFGAEIGSLDGLTLTGYWLHRNLFGGGERLRLDAEVAGIGASGASTAADIDYRLGARLDRPATIGPDTTGYTLISAERLSDPDYRSENLTIGLGFARRFSDRLNAAAGIGLFAARVEDSAGTRDYQALTLPVSVEWDRRNDALDPTRGFYLHGDMTPFLGFSGTGSGARVLAEARAYRGFGADDRFVLAGRLILGSVIGPDIADTPRDYLFHSGGAGTVRGQPYRALGVMVLGGGTVRSGGMSFLGLAGEVRAGITDTIGVVGFYDAGFVSAESLGGGAEFHAGAGLGLRYDTGIGPIRLDVAAPVAGSTGDGVQIYVGIGQSF